MAFESHLLKASDITESSLSHIPFGDQILQQLRDNSKAGTFLLAWLTTKLTEPVRLLVTILITPRIARMLGRFPK